MKYANLRVVDGRLARACPDCGREEPPWLAPSPGKTPVAVRCPCGYQYRYLPEPTERMLYILRDLEKQAAAQRAEAARKLRENLTPLESSSENSAAIPAVISAETFSQISHGNSQTSQISQPATPPPEAPAPPEPVKTNWKASPKLAAQMLKAMEPPEKRPPRMTLERRRIAFHLNLVAESRFQNQQLERAGRNLAKLLDQIDPEPDWATMPITPVWTIRPTCQPHLKAASSPPSKNASNP